MGKRLAIIGGDAAGMGTATQARRLDPNLEIVAFERGDYTSYSACGIPYVLGGIVDSLDRLVVRSPQEHRDRSHIDVRTRHEVTSIDLGARKLEVRDLGHGRTIMVPFDELLIGTGAAPLRPRIEGIDLPFVRGVQTLDDAGEVMRLAESMRGPKVVVVGGGYIGLEMAEAFMQRGARVAVLEKSSHVMGSLDADMARPIEDAMRRLGIDVRTGIEVTGFEERVVHTAAGSLDADLVILGLGVRPLSELAEAAGLDLGVKGAIKVDRRQRSSAEGVWAVGDCCESVHLVSGRAVHIALGTVANRQARVAGINIGGGYATFPGVLGTAITKICGTEISRTGLSSAEATAAGFEAYDVTAESTTTAGYLPEAARVRVRFVVEKGSGRLLGAQIVGGRGAAKRIDVAVACITARLSVEDIVDLDTSYAPAFGPLWDPITVTARAALRHR